MAHYKRRKCRYLGRNRRPSETFYRKRLGLRPVRIPEGPAGYAAWRVWFDKHRRIFWPAHVNSMNNWPRSWDIVMHTKPRRAQERQALQAVKRGIVDPDDATWPLWRKPHSYYW